MSFSASDLAPSLSAFQLPRFNATNGKEAVRHHPVRAKYAISFRDETGRLKRPSLGTTDRGLAEARAREFWQSYHKPSSERVEDLWRSYILDRQQDGKDTVRQGFAWKKLEPFFGYRLGSDVRKEDCKAYFAQRLGAGMSNSTVRTELEYVRACLNFRYGRGRNQVWLPPPSRPRDGHLTKEEVSVLLAKVTTPHVRLFIILAITTGARMSAILQLTWDRVDFRQRTIDFNCPGEEYTTKRRSVVPINRTALNQLTEAQQGAVTDYVIEWDGKSVASVKKALQLAAKRSGIHVSAHKLRHTAGVWIAQENIAMQKISQFLGHSSTRVTERHYARYSPSFMQDAADALELVFI